MVDRAAPVDEIDTLILGLIEDAENFSNNELSAVRARTWRYYNGLVDQPAKKDRSQVVATEVRDTVEFIMPSLMAMFCSAQNIVEFTVTKGHGNPEEAAADTETVNDIFYNDNRGWLLLHDSVKESLLARSGVFKVYEETYEEVIEEPIDPWDDMGEEIARLGGAEIVDSDGDTQSQEQEEGADYFDDGPKKVARFTISRKKVCIEVVPSEELLIDRRANDPDKAAIIGQRSSVRLGDLVAMGFPVDTVKEFHEETVDQPQQEQIARTGYSVTADPTSTGESKTHWALRVVTLKETYPLLDVDNTGKLERYQCFVINDKVLRRKRVEYQPYVVFSSIRIPHTAIGRCPGEGSIEFQEGRTALYRQMMDNVYWSNNPGLTVLRNAANPYQVQNWGFGQIVDIKVPGAVTPIEIPFIADKAILVMDWMEKQRESRTGGYRDALGLTPEKLRGATATASEGAQTQATRQLEMYARVIAEGGLTALYRKVYRVLKGRDTGLGMKVNVGLGNGTVQERFMALMSIAQKQEQIILQLGADNPLCSMDQYAYTLEKLAELTPYYDAKSFFKSPDEVKQILAAKAQQPQQAPPDPKMIEAQGKIAAVQQKTQADIANTQQKTQAQLQMEGQKAQMESGLKQQESQQKMALEVHKADAKIQMEQDKNAATIALDQQELALQTRLEAAHIAIQDKQGQGNIPKGKQRKGT